MKPLLILILTLLSAAKSCDGNSRDWESATISYSATTRGSQKNILIAEGKMAYTERKLGKENSETRELTDKEKKALFDEAAKINLNAINEYNPPSKKHQFDGAPITVLKVTYKGSIYTSQTFDHGNPPAELAAFINEILKLAPQEKE